MLRLAGSQRSGEGGIRTLGELAPTPVFETGTIGHSVTSPDWFSRAVLLLSLRLSWLLTPACDTCP